jgi:hypothetical protein
MKLLIIQLFLFSCYLISLRYKHLPQHPVPIHLYLISVTHGGDWSGCCCLDAGAWGRISPPYLNRTPNPRSFSHYTDWAIECKYVKIHAVGYVLCSSSSWCHIFFFINEKVLGTKYVGFELGLLCFWTSSIVRHSTERVELDLFPSWGYKLGDIYSVGPVRKS